MSDILCNFVNIKKQQRQKRNQPDSEIGTVNLKRANVKSTEKLTKL